jgi:negative regulator of flagellin synthesis FlgM
MEIIKLFFERRVERMKINDTGRIGAMNSYQRQIDSQRQEVNNKAKRKDEVSISAEAKELLRAGEEMQMKGSSERAERIAELKEQVSTGTYRVETGKLVEKLIPYFKSYDRE